MAKKGKQKWGWFLVVWLVLYVLVKSAEKMLMITLVFGSIYFITKYGRSLKNKDKKSDKRGKISKSDSYKSS